MGKCRFCDNQLSEYRGIYFCEQCRKVAYVSGMEQFQFKQIILDHIAQKRKMLLENHGELHDLLQNKLDGKQLSKEEINVINFCEKFTIISNELEYIINNTTAPQSSVRVRELLYEMLLLDKTKMGE